VSETVVGVLEAIEVYEHDSRAMTPRAVQRLCQPIEQPCPVRHAGQPIGQALLLDQPPGQNAGEARRQDEAAVNRRKQPGMGDRAGLRVDRSRVERADDPMLQDDEGQRQQERRPRLVQSEKGDHDKELEVRLDHASREVDEDR